MTEVRVEALGKIYASRGARVSEVVTLRDVSLRAPSGSFHAIIGPSGCGKSTLLRIIAGLEEPTTGAVMVGSTGGPRLGQSGYMPQHDALLPWRGVLDNATVSLEMAGTSRQEARRKATELLPIFGLAGFEHSYPATLSGGMRQRVALMRTILAGRSLLLLDEPFGALDALTRAYMQEWLLDVWARFGQTVVLVTHDVEEALYLADEVSVMSARPGTMVMSTHVDLSRPRPPYEELVTAHKFMALKRQVLDALRASGGLPGGHGPHSTAGNSG